ncbi:MAG: NADH dehydrogenase (quinone) subunit G [Deltaproteobacteria bacterium HGW-Deltaproteobacteria-21]|nr:MAG: NADH dehydrogenase (quinone) subunit G [Deltaproteobacteria bacterium HGW-Deltaproteobacteria-21]
MIFFVLFVCFVVKTKVLSNMPKLIIDDREIEVPQGTKVIEAAERLGIMIPRFCYHWILGSVGACRMCAVKMLHKEFKGVQMSCMIDAQDGMVVSTTHPEAVQFRKRVIEWLMLNHPHDCPVCDEGGHCLLQDETVSGGHGIRRYKGRKRTYHDQYLGVFVQHEMNRCIQCYRCARFYQDFCGYRDLGVMQIADKVYFGRYADGALESPFAGNLIDICPTGVYTDKPARYNYRRWELQRSPSLCIHCSLVCRTIANSRYREVIRQEAPVDELDRGFFICDRGRFGFPFTNLAERPRKPRVDGKEVTWEEAISVAAERLKRFQHESSAVSIACLGSSRASAESQAALKRLCRAARWTPPVYFVEPGTARKTMTAVSHLDESLAMSMQELEGADFILAVGADPVNESPVLALHMRQAWRKGARVAVIDPRPVSLPFTFHHLQVGHSQLEICLAFLVGSSIDRDRVESSMVSALEFFDALPSGDSLDPGIQNSLSGLASDLRKSRKVAIVCGTDIVTENTPALAADCVRLLRSARDSAGLLYLLREANSFGSALFSGPSSFRDTVRAIEAGEIKALIIVENDPFRAFPDRARLERVLSRLELLLVMDYLPSESVKRADIFLPASTMFETGSSFISHEGRIRFAHPVHAGGAPINQISGGAHPPRLFESTIPGGEPKPSWRLLLEIGEALFLTGESFLVPPGRIMAEELPHVEGFENYPLQDKSAIPERSGAAPFKARAQQGRAGRAEELELLLVEWTFGTEELAGYSPLLREVENEPVLSMHEEDAAAASIVDGDWVRIHLDGGSLDLPVRISGNTAKGTVVLPKHRRIVWQRIKEHPVFISRREIERLSGSK